MKKRNILLLSLAAFTLGSIHPVSALETENGWTEVAKGTTTVEIDKLKEFEEKLATRVEQLNLSSIASNLNELYRYRIETTIDEALETNKKISNEKAFSSQEEAEEWAAENEPQEDGWSFIKNIITSFQLDKIFNLMRFETKEEAEEAKTSFENSIDANSGSATITEIRDEADDVTTTIEDTRKFSTFEGAEEAANGLKEDNHDYVITVEVTKQNPEFVETETLNIDLTFATVAEAEAKVAELRNSGYTVTYDIQEVNATSTLNQVYEERNLAEQALSTFLTEYPKSTDSNITEVRDTTEDTSVTVNGTEEYTSLEAAQAAAAAKESDNSEYQVVAVTRKGTKTTTSSETIESAQFDTELEALNYIETLKNQGYDTSNLEVKLVPFEESIWGDEDDVVVNPGESDGTTFTYNHFDITLITQFTKIDANGNKTTVNGSVAISSVKINNTNIKMNSLSKDPNTGLYEYTSEERNKLNVTNQSLVEITGTVTFNNTTLPFTINGYLSESQNVCGGKGDAKGYDLEFASVTIINNRVIIDSNIINKYKVTGTATKTTTQDVWYVDTTTITKGYDYQVTASGSQVIGQQLTAIATKDIYQDVYTLNVKKTIKDYDYEVEGSGVKTYYDVITEYARLTDVEWIIESMSFGKGGDVEVLPPQTGVNDTSTTIFANPLFLIFAGIFLVIKKFM